MPVDALGCLLVTLYFDPVLPRHPSIYLVVYKSAWFMTVYSINLHQCSENSEGGAEQAHGVVTVGTDS